MSEQLTYEVFLDLCEIHPQTEFDQKASDYSFNILQNILEAKDCASFLLS